MGAHESAAVRGWRTVAGEFVRQRPLGLKQARLVGILAMALLGESGSGRPEGFVGRAAADEPAAARLPEITAKELAGKIRAAWELSDRGLLEVEFDETSNTNWKFDFDQGTAAEQEPIFVEFPGRVRFAGDGRLWRVESDSMIPTSLSTKLSPDHWTSGFDGAALYDWQIDRNLVVLGEAHGGAEQWKPRALFWHQGDSLVESLEKNDPAHFPVTIGQRAVDGVRCYVVEGGKPDAEWRVEHAISPRQGYLPLRRTQTRFGRTYHDYRLQDVREVAPGVWAPRRIELQWNTVRKDGATQLFQRRTLRVRTYEPNKAFDDGTFAFELPYDVDVTDRRLGASYRRDPWWPEVGAMLRERFDWPGSDLSPLRSLGTPSGAELGGKPAPAIRVGSWINSGPLALADLRGKVVLLEFWGTWCPPCIEKIPALRRLYEVYRPAGLEMISVHTPTADPDEVRRFVCEYRMDYPIAIDDEGDGSQGATAAAFGVQGYPCAFLIDHAGKVHPVGQATVDGGKLVETLIPLLERAGAKDVKAIELDHPRLSDEMLKAIDALFQQTAGAALAAAPEGRIAGRIVDGEGRSIAGAKVEATLQLTVLFGATPGGYHLFRYRKPVDRFAAPADADGRFELIGLCKGSYRLKAEAPGRAWAERRATVTPELEAVSLEVVLDQGGAISGQVRDEAGQPVAGASVSARQRQHVEGGHLRFTTSIRLDPVRTDAAGRFRIAGLQEGRYIFEVTAPGFEPGTMEGVPAGSEDATLNLKRARGR